MPVTSAPCWPTFARGEAAAGLRLRHGRRARLRPRTDRSRRADGTGRSRCPAWSGRRSRCARGRPSRTHGSVPRMAGGTPPRPGACSRRTDSGSRRILPMHVLAAAPADDAFPVWLSLRVALVGHGVRHAPRHPARPYPSARARYPGPLAWWMRFILLPLVLPPSVIGWYLAVVLGKRGMPSADGSTGGSTSPSSGHPRARPWRPGPWPFRCW